MMILDSDLEEGECSDSSCNESLKDLPKSSDDDQMDGQLSYVKCF